MIVTDPVCITPLDFASPGAYLTTKSLEADKASVEIRSLVSNGLPASANVTVECEITDAGGKSVGKISTNETVESRATKTATGLITLSFPHPWNGRNDPYLYTATIRVLRDQKVVDEITQALGLRTLAYSKTDGILLNGVPYPIHGVNRHQDLRDKGWAMSPEDEERDVRIISDMGVTAIRLSHYPQSEHLHNLCDREGLMLWNEVPLVSSIGIRDTPEFSANAELQAREMVLQHYNSPAATFWGLFNELDIQKAPPPDALLTHLKAVIQELDPTRIDVAATAHPGRTFNTIPTAICFNTYPGWYKGNPNDMAKFISDRFEEMGERICISEFGGGANTDQHQEGSLDKVNPKGPFHPEEWQSYIHERIWKTMQNNQKLWGCFIWVMFDLPSAGRDEGGQTGLNDKGLVTQDRATKKDAYFFYKANWNLQPMVYIASRRSTPRKVAVTEVKAYSNSAEVELIVNGQSLGKTKPDAVKIAHWENVLLLPGNNHIEVIGSSSTEKPTDSCDWVLEASSAPAP
ncbi:glycoside hydrolase family 2 TIM barrel-domain containing protein [Verrucomicrobium sp. GAS474]|uniref:glycoside hydrolase family 2 protein n=1 Tax=Verrucomicrobium sp. GAS474 TaxID=1882831 RepID=UPI000B819E43|nr:glycoside hydrolase family 2 TIM barrel-domain containing protein [Verrucomicrobium sp. GAS474]